VSDFHGCEYESDSLLGKVIALRIEAASSSETSVNFQKTTRRNITEDCHAETYNK
jgi:hypothetical protein